MTYDDWKTTNPDDADHCGMCGGYQCRGECERYRAEDEAAAHMPFLLVCRNNGCLCGREATLERAQKAAREQSCGHCDGHLRVDFDFDTKKEGT